jgi:HlyD family secretion protein
MYRSPLLNKAIIPAGASLALAYAVYATGVMRPQVVPQEPLAPPPQRAFTHSVAAVGIIEPASELIAVAPRVAGWIEVVHVVAGQRIDAGQPLFTLDGADLRAELAFRHEGVVVAEARLSRLRASPRPEDVPIARAGVAEAASKLQDAQDKLRFVEAVTNARAVSEEDRSQRRQAVARSQAELAAKQGELDRLLAGAWKEDITVAERELELARAAMNRTQADLDRMTTRAPIDAIVLRLTARAGQYAPAGVLDEPLVTLGSPAPFHVRADINEQDLPRMRAAGRAFATVRGDGATRHELEFIRFEPLVVPKRALSGFAQERVDTRVLQAIFRLTGPNEGIFVGQQVDIYIENDHPDAA